MKFFEILMVSEDKNKCWLDSSIYKVRIIYLVGTWYVHNTTGFNNYVVIIYRNILRYVNLL